MEWLRQELAVRELVELPLTLHKFEQEATETTERCFLCFLRLLGCLALFETHWIRPFTSMRSY